MKQIIWSVFISLALSAASRGATNAPPLTIDALVAEALARHPELAFYQAEMEAAKAGRKAAGLPGNPELSGTAGYKSARAEGLRAEGAAWSVSLAQPFEWPGRIGLRKAIANRDIDLAELGLERFRRALAAKVRAASYELFAAREKAAAAAEVADRFKALREVLVQRDPAGLTPLLETRIIEASEVSLHRQAAAAELEAQTALLALNQLRGAALNERLALLEPKFEFRPLQDTAALLALARTNNFELRLRAVELAQQGFRLELARNERFPTVSVGPSLSEERAGDRERVLSLGVSIPLPLWKGNKAAIELAAARQLQAQASLQAAEREIDRQVLEAAAVYQAKLQQMSLWRPDAPRYFREAAELADRHYRLGAAPIAAYVELQDKYLEAIESLLETKKEALQAAQELESLTGLAPSPVTTLN